MTFTANHPDWVLRNLKIQPDEGDWLFTFHDTASLREATEKHNTDLEIVSATDVAIVFVQCQTPDCPAKRNAVKLCLLS